VLFPPPEDPPIPIPPDKLRKQKLTLQNVFDAGELLHANIDPNTHLSDLEFRQLLGLPENVSSSGAVEYNMNRRNGNEEERDDIDDEKEDDDDYYDDKGDEQGEKEQDAVTSYTPTHTVSSLGTSSSSTASSFAILNSSVKDRHSGGVLQHHFYSPSSLGKDSQDSTLRLPVISRAPQQSNSEPAPLFHRALDESTRAYLAGLGDDSVDSSSAVSSSVRARIRSDQDMLASSSSVASSSPRLAVALPPLSHSVGSGGHSVSGDMLEDGDSSSHPHIVFQHSTNSYIDSEMSRNTANQVKHFS